MVKLHGLPPSWQLRGLGVDSIRLCHTLVLPKCESVSLYRSDDLDYLRLYAPNMIELNLQVMRRLQLSNELQEI
jgi:hypothetical protein